MKVLVTGGSGFLGRRVVRYLGNAGFQVLAPGHGQLDITEDPREWFRQNRPEAVIHTAAVSDTGLCQKRPEWSETINVTGSVNLAGACAETGAKLVLCSSDQVYSGSPLSGPHGEGESVTPSNVYGCQKLRAEESCLAIAPDTVCLRLSWMYAKDSFAGEHGHFLSTLRKSLEDRSLPLTWPVHDHRGLTDVEAVVRNLPQALELAGGVWNFGSENARSTYDTVKRVLEELGLEEALQRLKPNTEAFALQPRDISMDLSRLNRAGIFFPTTEESLRQALAGERF